MQYFLKIPYKNSKKLREKLNMKTQKLGETSTAYIFRP